MRATWEEPRTKEFHHGLLEQAAGQQEVGNEVFAGSKAGTRVVGCAQGNHLFIAQNLLAKDQESKETHGAKSSNLSSLKQKLQVHYD